MDLDKVYGIFEKRRLEEAKLNVMANMMSDMNEFVPLDQNPLQTSVHIDADGEHLVWETPYARAQYYGTNGKVTFRKYTTAGTGPYWDKVASSNYMDQWEDSFLTNLGL